MNWLDILLLALLVLNLISGYCQGLIRQMIGLIGFLVSIAVAVYGSSWLGGIIEGYVDPAWLMPLQEVSNQFGLNITADWAVSLAAKIASFLILMILAKFLLSLLASTFTDVNRLPVVGTVNRLAGLALGLARGLILVMLLVGLFSLLPLAFVAEAMSGSTLAAMVGRWLPQLAESLKSLLITCL